MIWQIRRGLIAGRSALDATAAAGSSVTVDTGSIASGLKASAGTQTLTGVTLAAGSTTLIVGLNFDMGGSTAIPIITSVVWDAAGVNQALSLIQKAPSVSTVGPVAFLYGATGITPGTSKTITLTTTLSTAVFMHSIAFSGADQTGGTTTFSSPTEGTNITTVSVTSTSGGIVTAVGYSGSAQGTVTGTTIYKDEVSGAFINAMANYMSGTGGAVNIGVGNTGEKIAACNVKAA